MPRATYGDNVKARVKRLFAALISLNDLNEDNCGISFKWQESGSLHRKLVVKTTLRHLETLTKKDGLGHLTKTQIREALKQMQNFLGILEDNRLHERGTENWDFTLKPWFTETAKNLKQFEIEWENRRPEKSKQLAAATLKVKSTEYKSQAPSETLLQTSTPSFSTYNPKTWTGREDVIAHLSETLNEGCRVLILYGLTGIGKTALAERLASDFVGVNGTHSLGIPFYRISLDVCNLVQTFSQGAIAILQAMGDDTAQKLPDDQLLPYLLQTLERRSCWLQLDSLEYVLHQTQQGVVQFADATWVRFFYQFLTSPGCQQSRMILTSQALPVDLVERCDRFPQFWCEFHLRGLEAENWLDLFRNYGVAPQTVAETDYLCNIAQHFDGHPLILKMIAGDIRNPLFSGSVAKYWHDYYSQRQSLQIYQSQEQRARNWVNLTLQQLSDTPRQMLQHCAVYRRAVPESFYLTMVDASDDRAAALLTLKSRYLVEEDIQSGQLLIRQHNLIRDVAYANLKLDCPTWLTAERKASERWLSNYEAVVNAPDLERVRGYLEAFYHLSEIEAWNEADEILRIRPSEADKELGDQLGTWGYYREQIEIYSKLRGKLAPPQNSICLKNLGVAYRLLDNYPKAREFYSQALNLFFELGQREEGTWILYEMGIVKANQGEDEEARGYYERALKIFEDLDVHKGIALVLNDIARVEVNQGNYKEAIKRYEKSLNIYPDSEDRTGRAWILCGLGQALLLQGEYIEARNYINRSLTLFRELENRVGIAWSLHRLGNVMLNLGDEKSAYNFIWEALTRFRELQTQTGIAWTLHLLGRIEFRRGNFTVIPKCYREKILIWKELNNLIGIAFAIEGFARFFAMQQPKKQLLAPYLFGAAEALREAIKCPVPAPDRVEYNLEVDEAKKQIDEAEFLTAWNLGKATPIKQVISEILAIENED